MKIDSFVDMNFVIMPITSAPMTYADSVAAITFDHCGRQASSARQQEQRRRRIVPAEQPCRRHVPSIARSEIRCNIFAVQPVRVRMSKKSDIRPSEITSRENYLNRREFIRAGAIAGSALLAPPALGATVPSGRRQKLDGVIESPFSTDEPANSYEDITTYNNFYEFGTGKEDPAVQARDFVARPWKVTVDGHADRTGTFDFDDFIKPFDLEERIYRMRCVEAWSMVIPWVGISLAEVVRHLQKCEGSAGSRETARGLP